MTNHLKRLLVAVALAPTAALAGLALVGNENAGSITLIDTARDEVVGEIKTGGKPRGAAIHAAGELAYVSDQPSNALLVVDLEKRAVTKKRHLGESPEGVYISAEAQLLATARE